MLRLAAPLADGRRTARSSCSARTGSGATCSRACSTARAFRCSSGVCADPRRRHASASSRGLVAGYFGGWIDDVIMRLGDIQLAFPFILLAIMFLVVLGPGLTNIIIVLGIGQWVTYARIVRAQTLSLREKEYVEAARALGDPHLLDHLPHHPAQHHRAADRHRLVQRGLRDPVGGLAVVPRPRRAARRADLGLDAGARAATSSSPTSGGSPSFPGLAIVLTVLAFNILGDWLRDFLDPRLKTIALTSGEEHDHESWHHRRELCPGRLSAGPAPCPGRRGGRHRLGPPRQRAGGGRSVRRSARLRRLAGDARRPRRSTSSASPRPRSCTRR